MRIVCLTHVGFEGPGSIELWARLREHSLERLSIADAAPPAADEVDMLVVMGGPMSADDDRRLPWLGAEKRFISRVINVGTPVLGICLGAQLVALSLGGTLSRNPEPEVGWLPVRLTPAGRAARPFAAWPDTFVAGHWHSDTYALPEGFASAAASDACENQAFEAYDGRVVGLQFHLEWTNEALAELVAACGDELQPGPHVQTAGEILGHPEHLESGRALLFGLLDTLAAAGA